MPTFIDTPETSTDLDKIFTVFLYCTDKWSESFCDFILKALIKAIQIWNPFCNTSDYRNGKIIYYRRKRRRKTA